MPFELGEAGANDVDELGSILHGAYVKDPIIPQLMPGVDPETQGAFWAAWLRGDLNKPGQKMFKIVDTDTGKIAAFVKVRYPAKPEEDVEEDHADFPEGANVLLLLHWFEQMDTYTSRHIDYEKDYYVNVLSTLPEYHRKGLGSMLLNRFLDDADKANAKTYLQATETGAGLYPRFGWKDIENMTITTPKGPVIWRCMMREPNSGRRRP